MAGAGSSNVLLSLARDGGAAKLPYCSALPGLRASPDRSSCAGAPLFALTFADAGWYAAGSSAGLVLRGGVKLWWMPKKWAGAVAGGAPARLVSVGVALARLMARVTALTCFLPAL
jgi:hypothetical protein